MKKIFLALAIVSSLFITSCKKEDEVTKNTTSDIELTSKQLDQNRIEFAKILAKAISNENVRMLLKREAAKQFDLDYDVLFQMVKDTEISSGLSLSKYLAHLADSEENFSKITESLPLLTIMVPDLKNFSVEEWDVATQIPLIAIVNSDHDEINHKQLITFDHLGNQLELQSNIEPTVPVIVVKENERVTALNKNGRYSYSTQPDGSFIFSKEGNSFYFTNDAFDKKNEEKLKAARLAIRGTVDQRLRDAYHLGAVSQRDYVYYNILNSTDRGPINTNYAEYLTSLRFVNKQNMDTAINDENLLGDWTDGSFEFSLEFLHFNGTSGSKNDNKVFSVHGSDLIYTDGSMKIYYPPYPILINTWDYKSMGDTWRIIVQELDQAATKTVTTQVGAKFGTNFSYNASIGKEEKIGIGGGSTAEQSFSVNVAYQTTQASDNLGSVTIPFTQKVITGRGSTNPLAGYHILDLNTGNIMITMEPRLIQ